MNLFHLIYLLILIIFLVLAIWIKKGVIWGVELALIIYVSYNAVIDGWEVLYFIPIVGLFIISIMGFIYTSIEGDLF